MTEITIPDIDDDLIESIFANHRKNRRFSDNADPVQDPDALLHAYADFHNEAEKHLAPGMLVQWKPRMRSRSIPAYHEPCVVMRLIERREVMVDSESGFQACIDRVDMEIGLFDPEGDLIVMTVDKRRFMPWAAQ